MTTTDWIQFWLAIGTGLLAIISTISIIIVLIQNNIIIENSKRPFIIIYKDIISINGPIEYLVIKNSGNTTAHITSISYDDETADLISGNYPKITKALKYLNDSYIAPNQSYKIPIKSKESNIKNITFSVCYTNGKKKYSDSFDINLQQDYGIPSMKSHTSNGELETISNSLQELIKRI